MFHVNHSDFESLEPRRLLSTSTTTTDTPNDTLLVRGTNADDLITLDIRSDGGIKFARVNLNGTRRDFDLTGIHHIRIESLDGPDTVVIDEDVVRGIEINGGLGDDNITCGSGNDTVIGGRGQDIVTGNDGNDKLRGDTGLDTLIGGDGNDRLDGGDGGDDLEGQDGNDSITGGAGEDMMFGGDGDDQFFARDNFMDNIAGGNGTNRAQIDSLDLVAGVRFEIP